MEVTLNNAGSRKRDVFVGVDVFGRGCRGGGGFGTVEAVEAVRKWELSVALFAPGWVHECCLPGEHFLSRDYKFWDYLCDHLYVQGPSFLPFRTTFLSRKRKEIFRKRKTRKRRTMVRFE
uniref:Cytosolic endo-beta-n-acetylglucosaminidase n=1 Tax=Triatoma infestans TaxID=30076 RepID=A0A161MJH9_TRIIF